MHVDPGNAGGGLMQLPLELEAAAAAAAATATPFLPAA